MGCSQSNLPTEPVSSDVDASTVNTNPVLEDFPVVIPDKVAEIPAKAADGHSNDAAAVDVLETEDNGVPTQVEPAKAYVILDEVVYVKGVVHYTVQDQSGQTVHKRYSEFKKLHDSLCKTPNCEDMPQAGVWTSLQRSNPALIANRRTKFEVLLNTWASDDETKQMLAAFMNAAA
ncbi:hypothetical protein DYB28_010539 [Aphanomyces astaci]|uniref:PX domain-containing protein n=1 Tax=Aphanomyces astaci TaxID=112090 RepID=A0A397DDA6_APHAT|nr:hypothetical protein DYB36_007667 [Aphanomyces astaci]RHY20875.1 hypothetical protein DYB25_005873 [Aphanomyces astaci]RHY60484.1 hypothetical protein DYB30_007869 [Aphanomyces astaci]RHY62586.1 hypothetical protein DYB34_003525 [Aphanomyces astaci]RHY71774.1 hypothetical protein DYB38_009052 [Aphanomyces astaci]